MTLDSDEVMSLTDSDSNEMEVFGMVQLHADEPPIKATKTNVIKMDSILPCCCVVNVDISLHCRCTCGKCAEEKLVST